MGRETRHECRILPKGVLNMKYCPYCGADFADGAASFCMECGKSLPIAEDGQKKAKRETRKVAKAYGKEAQAPVPQATEKT